MYNNLINIVVSNR